MKEKRNNCFFQRGFTAQLRATGDENKGHRITGLAAVYEQETVLCDFLGEFREVIRRGAFDETDFSDVRLLVNHDMNGIALARSRQKNGDTMQLTVDEKGVNIVADLDTENNEQARALYSAIERGDMDGMSFCFYVSENNQRWSKNKSGTDVREILKIDKVIEVSAVNFPAYEGTNISSRSICDTRRPHITDYKAKALIKMYKGE